MKFLILSGIVFSVLTGCQTENIKVQKEQENDNTEMWEIQISKPVFSSTDPQKCKVVNDRVAALIDSLKNDFKVQVKAYNQAFDTIPDAEPMRPLEMFVEDSVFMANSNYISLRLKVYISLGGANGETKYYALNYDLKNGKFLSKGDILDLKQANEINRVLKQEFKNPDECFSEQPTVNTCSALNFMGKKLCFTYGKYVLGAGACGDAIINVDCSKLNNCLLIK